MKTYLLMWVQYCRKHEIRYAICPDGTIEEIMFDNEEEWPQNLMFGTKAAYDWLIETHKELKGE